MSGRCCRPESTAPSRGRRSRRRRRPRMPWRRSPTPSPTARRVRTSRHRCPRSGSLAACTPEAVRPRRRRRAKRRPMLRCPRRWWSNRSRPPRSSCLREHPPWSSPERSRRRWNPRTRQGRRPTRRRVALEGCRRRRPSRRESGPSRRCLRSTSLPRTLRRTSRRSSPRCRPRRSHILQRRSLRGPAHRPSSPTERFASISPYQGRPTNKAPVDGSLRCAARVRQSRVRLTRRFKGGRAWTSAMGTMKASCLQESSGRVPAIRYAG
jgi:hypothetical protein